MPPALLYFANLLWLLIILTALYRARRQLPRLQPVAIHLFCGAIPVLTLLALLKTAAATALSALAHPVLAAPNRAASPSNRSNTMTATLHYQNAELSYQLGGKADAPAIVLLHGELGSAEDFAPLLPRLQAHFRTLAIDTRGHGRSTRGDVPLTYAQTADDARQIIEAVGLR